MLKLEVITLGNEDRFYLNQTIREGLIQQGELSGFSFRLPILQPRLLSEAEKSQVLSYQIGNILRFHTSDRLLGIQKGEYWQVTSAFPDYRVLQLQKPRSPHSKPILWKLPNRNHPEQMGWEVYQLQHREARWGI